MRKPIVLLEDEQELADLVSEFLEEEGFAVYHVTTVEKLLEEAAVRSPCVALLDSTHPSGYDLWWVGPKLNALGVPPVAFTAHASAQQEFEADNHGFAAVIAKPFDADEFIDTVESICWEEYKAAAL